MSELSTTELRGMYHDAVRREVATPGKFISEAAVVMARKLCEAEGNDPDQMVFGVGGEPVENGPRGTFVAPRKIVPAWAAYYHMAAGFIENAKETEKAA